MKKRYEITDKAGRFMTAEYDDDKNQLMVTMYMSPEKGLTITEVFDKLGWIVTKELKVEKPKVLQLKGRADV